MAKQTTLYLLTMDDTDQPWLYNIKVVKQEGDILAYKIGEEQWVDDKQFLRYFRSPDALTSYLRYFIKMKRSIFESNVSKCNLTLDYLEEEVKDVLS